MKIGVSLHTQILGGIHNGQKSELMMLRKGNIHVTSEKLWVIKTLNTLCLYWWKYFGLRCFPGLEVKTSQDKTCQYSWRAPRPFPEPLEICRDGTQQGMKKRAYSRISDPKGYVCHTQLNTHGYLCQYSHGIFCLSHRFLNLSSKYSERNSLTLRGNKTTSHLAAFVVVCHWVWALEIFAHNQRIPDSLGSSELGNRTRLQYKEPCYVIKGWDQRREERTS